MSDIGYMAELVAKREAIVKNLSPTARHQAFPKLFAKPVPYAGVEQLLRTKIAVLESEKADLANEVAALRHSLSTMESNFDTEAHARALRLLELRHSPEAVMNVFLEELNILREPPDRFSILHLASGRRTRGYVAPRHVCIWLVRQLCAQCSLPQIGRMFGNRDHTTIMHACMRAPLWLMADPTLKAAADATLARFPGPEATDQREEGVAP